MPLFEVAVLSKPSKNDLDAGMGVKLLLGPKAVAADDERGAIVEATKGVALPSGIEVLVRPFK